MKRKTLDEKIRELSKTKEQKQIAKILKISLYQVRKAIHGKKTYPRKKAVLSAPIPLERNEKGKLKVVVMQGDASECLSALKGLFE